jgi:A/G-specific adenine glycosylase
VLDAHDQQALLDWYDAHQRDLPWRQTNDPWAILLSEVLLQQTQVSRGLVYWQRMVEAFPTLQSMADAPVDAVLKAWEGAGYYSRARRLHALCQRVMHPGSEGGFDGQLPSTYDALLSLPGIGPYTAAAVASIAFGQPVACVDGNIRRVMARITAQAEPTPHAVQAWADAAMVDERPGDWNQALMELGATVCTPKRVRCEACPVRGSCLGMNDAEAYPLPKRQRVKEVVLTAWVEWARDGNPVLTQRPMDGLFAGLWGPTYHEGLCVPDHDHVHCGVVKHALSHRNMTVHVVLSTAQTVQSGVDVGDVALSALDEKVLALAGVHRQKLGH